MEERKYSKVETYVAYIIVTISLITGSFGTFLLYINKSITVKKELRAQINQLLDQMYVSVDKRAMVMFAIGCVSMLLLWILGFIMYKVIFKVAKIFVKDGELLIAIGSAYIISFLIGYYISGHINNILVTFIVNFIEMSVVFIGLFDKIKEKIGIFILIRGIVLVLNVALVIW